MTAPGSSRTWRTPVARGIPKKRLRHYAHSRLPIIDELGHLDVGSAGRGPAVPADIDALRAALDDHHHQRGDQRLGQGARGRRGGGAIADRVPPPPPGQDNRQVLQAEGPCRGDGPVKP